ncbi:hypothetical protein BCR42DRAFT_413263 [Absidia repens]|uniref:Uncharacterized protein n=1 Tax=Absidia repens TaxID=90262 RepID=A0A1X2IKT8_9FUNG|nr:hypothetical protein BCR42DRAFT_413263 [Absidia repens]
MVITTRSIPSVKLPMMLVMFLPLLLPSLLVNLMVSLLVMVITTRSIPSVKLPMMLVMSLLLPLLPSLPALPILPVNPLVTTTRKIMTNVNLLPMSLPSLLVLVLRKPLLIMRPRSVEKNTMVVKVVELASNSLVSPPLPALSLIYIFFSPSPFPFSLYC